MKRMKFQEYLNSRGKVEKPIISLDGDEVDPKTSPVKPPKAAAPYKCSDGKPKTCPKKGFGDDGDPKLKYYPDVDYNDRGKAPAKIPTVEQAETLSLLVKKLQADPTLMETVVRQFKVNGLLGAVVAEMLEHRETYRHLSQVMAHENYGPVMCAKLVRAMNEEVAPPFHDQIEDDESEEHEDDDMTGTSDLDNADQSDGEGIHDGEPVDNIDVDMEPETNADPTMGGGDVDPMMGDEDMDPTAMTTDPNMLDPNMLDPHMAQGNPALQNFQNAMMRAMMRAMMSKV